MIDELDEPFGLELTEWGSEQSTPLLSAIADVAEHVHRQRALEAAEHLPDHLRHAKHKRSHPECAVCAQRTA